MLVDYGRSDAKAFARAHLEGIYSAIVVPETDDYEIDEAGLRQNVRHCLDDLGSAGIYVHGYYGHYWLMTGAERRRVVEIVADEVDGQALIISRCAHPSLKEAIELAQHSEQVGADIISMVGPVFGGASDDVVFAYFETLAAEIRLGISVFNTPYAGYLMSPELMARLATIPNVVALKNAAPIEHTVEVRKLAGDAIVVVDPIEERALTSFLEYGQRLLYTNTNYMYDSAKAQPMHDYVSAALAGDHAAAIEGFEAMQPLRDVHTKWVRGGWHRWGQCPVSIVKLWAEQMGMRGGASRPPLPVLGPAEQQELRSDLERVGLA